MKLPSGPGVPALDTRDAIAQATTTCQGVRTLSAEVAVSGSVGGQRLRGRMLVGVAAPASARIEAVAPFGPPVFIFVARDADATLLLPRDERVLEHGKPREVLEAVAGIPLDGMDLRRALTGCPSLPDREAGRTVGDDWRVVPDGPDQVYLHRDARTGPWRVVAIQHASEGASPWRAEYKTFESDLPRAIRLVSDKGTFDIRMSLSQVDLNVTLGDEVFRVQIPRSAVPIALEELKRARPGIRKN